MHINIPMINMITILNEAIYKLEKTCGRGNVDFNPGPVGAKCFQRKNLSVYSVPP